MSTTTEDNGTHDRMGTLFNDFLAAAEAIKQRPMLEAKVADAEAERNYHKVHAGELARHIAEQDVEIADLKARLAKQEADLAQATFREKEVRDQRQVLLDTLRGVVKEVTDTATLVDPPAPEVKQEQANPTSGIATPATSTQDSKGQSATDPTPGQSVPTTGGDTSAIGQFTEGYHNDKADPTTPTGEATGQATGGGDTSTSSTEVASNASGPFASSTEGQSSAAPQATGDQPQHSATETTTTASIAATASQPEAKPYWLKPSDQSWKEWQAVGNVIPNWINPADDSINWH